MSKATFSLPILPLVLMFSFIISGRILKPANAQGKTWCVAKPSSSDAELAANIEYACSYINDGCNIIKEGGSCYFPNTLLNHASVAMNLYYQFNGRNTWNCDFRGSALTTATDPSYGPCQYA